MTIAHPSSITQADDALSTVLNRRRQGLFNTRVVLSDVVASLLTAGVLGLAAGVWTIAVVVPDRLGTVEKELARFSQQSEQRLHRLEQNDQTQDDRILRLESSK